MSGENRKSFWRRGKPNWASKQQQHLNWSHVWHFGFKPRRLPLNWGRFIIIETNPKDPIDTIKHRQLAHEANWRYQFWWDYPSSRRHRIGSGPKAIRSRASFGSCRILNEVGTVYVLRSQSSDCFLPHSDANPITFAKRQRAERMTLSSCGWTESTRIELHRIWKQIGIARERQSWNNHRSLHRQDWSVGQSIVLRHPAMDVAHRRVNSQRLWHKQVGML